MTDLRDLRLTPRAIAALCSLRMSARSARSVALAIGDIDRGDTVVLLADIAADHGFVVQSMPAWQLTDRGVAWCEAHGMRVCPNLYPSAIDLEDARNKLAGKGVRS